MYAQTSLVTSVRGAVFLPHTAASASLSFFGAKMPSPFFFIANAFFFDAALMLILLWRRFSAVIFFSAAFVIVVFFVVVVTFADVDLALAALLRGHLLQRRLRNRRLLRRGSHLCCR